MSDIIRLDDVWKIFKIGDTLVKAVAGVSLSIPSNDYVIVVGPSGSGKSTLMNLIGALDVPTKGHIYLNGEDIGKMSESELAQLRGKTVGFVFQQFNLIPTLTAAQNVELPMMFYGYSQKERKERAYSLLSKVGLEHRVHHFPNKMSGGEQQRVAIARSLANNPDLILADEPTGNLDSKTGTQIMDLLANLHKEGKTVVLVTHDLELVTRGRRVIYIKDGVIAKVKRNHKK